MIGTIFMPVSAWTLSIAKIFIGSAIARVKLFPIREIGMIWYLVATSCGIILTTAGSIFKRAMSMGGSPNPALMA